MSKASYFAGVLAIILLASVPANASDITAANTAIARRVFAGALTK
jgi:hypothetical protein